MKPLRDIIVITLDPEETEKKSASGIYLGEEKWKKPRNTGTITAVGPEVINLKVKQRVVINPYAVLDTDTPDVKLLKESDVLCNLAAK